MLLILATDGPVQTIRLMPGGPVTRDPYPMRTLLRIDPERRDRGHLGDER